MFTVNHLYANVWSRSKEERDFDNKIRERRLITIALLAEQGFAVHLKEIPGGTFFAGIQEGELVEVVIHFGWPAGTHGQKVIQQTYKEYLGETVKLSQVITAIRFSKTKTELNSRYI